MVLTYINFLKIIDFTIFQLCPVKIMFKTKMSKGNVKKIYLEVSILLYILKGHWNLALGNKIRPSFWSYYTQLQSVWEEISPKASSHPHSSSTLWILSAPCHHSPCPCFKSREKQNWVRGMARLCQQRVLQVGTESAGVVCSPSMASPTNQQLSSAAT